MIQAAKKASKLGPTPLLCGQVFKPRTDVRVKVDHIIAKQKRTLPTNGRADSIKAKIVT